MFNFLFKQNKIILTIFLLVVVISTFFRFYNLNWDLGYTFHPDERNIDSAVSRISFFSNLNPAFFAYGGFPIYLYRITGDFLNFILKEAIWTTDWGHINLIGRIYSAFFSVLSLIPIYFITKRLFDRKTGWVAVFLYGFCVTSIQTAHYAVTESLITFIALLVCLSSIHLVNKLNLKTLLFLSIVSGVGLATKSSSMSFLIMPVISFLFLLKQYIKDKRKIFLSAVFFVLLSFFIFFIFSPFTFFDFKHFTESMKYESSVATGALPVVYTLQFDETLPYIFWTYNLFWQVGPVALFCILGFAFIFIKSIRIRRKELIIFISFPLIYFLYVGLWHTKFIRYIVPIVPFFLISAALFLVSLSQKFKRVGNFLIAIVVVCSFFWSLAFFQIYLNPQTRVSASYWIYDNIPKNSKILEEQWDDGLPIALENNSPSLYQITGLDMYSTDNKAKIDYLASNLEASRYIVFNSRRLYATLIRLKGKYPITSNYYKLLFAGKLGYKKIAEFSQYPNILGVKINDDASEETFQVYDHPKVIIFENQQYLTFYKLQKILRNEIIP